MCNAILIWIWPSKYRSNNDTVIYIIIIYYINVSTNK